MLLGLLFVRYIIIRNQTVENDKIILEKEQKTDMIELEY